MITKENETHYADGWLILDESQAIALAKQNWIKNTRKVHDIGNGVLVGGFAE